MQTIFKLLALGALLVVGVAVGLVPREAKSDPPIAPAVHSPRTDDWQRVTVSGTLVPPNMDGTVYVYDRNSIVRTEEGAEVTVRIVAGDRSVLNKQVRLGFFCHGGALVRVNDSYPIPYQGPSQEYQLANIACGAVRRF